MKLDWTDKQNMPSKRPRQQAGTHDRIRPADRSLVQAAEPQVPPALRTIRSAKLIAEDDAAAQALADHVCAAGRPFLLRGLTATKTTGPQ
jgi:hypothetical protein